MTLQIYDRIRVRTLKYFNNFKVNMKYDAVASTFSFSYLFDPNNPEHKELSCIGHFHECTLEHEGEILIKGNVLSINFVSSPKVEMVTVSGYSLPGILEDISIIPNAKTESSPLQFNNLSLNQIVDRVISPYRLKRVTDPIVAASANEVYVECKANIGETIKPYLSRLAAQKNIVLSHNAKGNLVLTRLPRKQEPVFAFELGKTTGASYNLSFDGQQMHSKITVVEQPDLDTPNSTVLSEAINPYVIRNYQRPKIVVSNARSVAKDSTDTARNLLAQELKGIKLTINTDKWGVNGKVWRPGQEITVLNPQIYLYEKARFVIESVELDGNPESTTATLTCMIPEVYNGVYPVKYLWQGINLH